MHVSWTAGRFPSPRPSIEIRAEGKGTKFVLTEYGDYLDGYDDAGSREHGTNFLMDALGKSLAGLTLRIAWKQKTRPVRAGFLHFAW